MPEQMTDTIVQLFPTISTDEHVIGEIYSDIYRSERRRCIRNALVRVEKLGSPANFVNVFAMVVARRR